jgi:DNA-binding response OmpR family regulator
MPTAIGQAKLALVVDDAPDMVAMIVAILRKEGFEVSSASDGAAAVEMVRALEPDLVVLDLTMPKIDGVEVCTRLRAFSDAYVIMLTARTDEADLLTGLAVGADDYMTKPFSARELAARVRSVMRRPRNPMTPPVERRVGALVIDVAAREVLVDEVEIELTRIEFDLLATLSGEPRVSFTRAMLLDRVWGPDWYGDDHLVDVHVANLRRKLHDDPRAPRYVRTIRGIGYRMGDGTEPA